MLMTCFGAPETWFELLDVLPHDGWADALAEFGALYLLDPSERGHLPGEVAAAFPGGWIWPGARFAAFAAVRLRRPDLAARAWRALLTRNADDGQYIPTEPRTATHPFAGAVGEMQTSTNCAAQWSLNVIECLALIGDQLPEEGPLRARIPDPPLLFRAREIGVCDASHLCRDVTRACGPRHLPRITRGSTQTGRSGISGKGPAMASPFRGSPFAVRRSSRVSGSSAASAVTRALS
jgi:hypothetical protein